MIAFGCWAPDRATFWNSWIARGICTEPEMIHPEYLGLVIFSQDKHGWTPTKATGNTVTDPMGNQVPERVPVPGYHVNGYVYEPLLSQFIYGLAQNDESGNLLSIWDRTWAKEVFGLTWYEADPVTGFPAGYGNSAGVRYADYMDFSSPRLGVPQ